MAFEREGDVCSVCRSEIEREEELDVTMMELRHGDAIATASQADAVLDGAVQGIACRQWDGNTVRSITVVAVCLSGKGTAAGITGCVLR